MNTISTKYVKPAESFVRVAAIQMVSGTNLAHNLHEAEKLIRQAAFQGAKIVLLPECFALLPCDNKTQLDVKERLGKGAIQQFLSQMAAKYHIWLFGGTIPLEAQSDDKLRNSLLVFDDQGQLQARYDKIHLFSLTLEEQNYNEALYIEAGNKVESVITPMGKVGLSICYDLRFPELYRQCGTVDFMMLPAAFTYVTGKAHWEVLIKARAIENQCFMIASAQGGEHENGRHTWGHTMIVNPWGEIINCLEQGAGIVMADLDMRYLLKIRQSLPALRDKRLI